MGKEEFFCTEEGIIALQTGSSYCHRFYLESDIITGRKILTFFTQWVFCYLWNAPFLWKLATEKATIFNIYRCTIWKKAETIIVNFFTNTFMCLKFIVFYRRVFTKIKPICVNKADHMVHNLLKIEKKRQDSLTDTNTKSWNICPV